jgi:hypothetical protein
MKGGVDEQVLLIQDERAVGADIDLASVASNSQAQRPLEVGRRKAIFATPRFPTFSIISVDSSRSISGDERLLGVEMGPRRWCFWT